MPTYTFNSVSTHQYVNWSSPANWIGGVVPNSADADVLIPNETIAANGDPYFISILTGQSYEIQSLDIVNDHLLLYGTLSIANGLSLAGELDMDGGSLSIGSLQISAFDVQGYGQISSAGSIVNQGLITGGGLTLSFAAFQNVGELMASAGLTTVTTPSGGFENLIGSTLTGGTYAAENGGVLDLNVGGLIVTDAATLNIGSLAANVIASFDVNTGVYDPIQSTLQTIAPAGVLTLDGNAFVTANTLTVAGTLDLIDAATLSAGQLDVASGGVVAASGSIAGPIENTGTVTASLNSSTPNNLGSIIYSDVSSGDLVLQSSVAGTGSLVVAAAAVASTIVATASSSSTLTYAVATLELAGPVSENVSFASNMGSLVLDVPQSFSGTIVPFGVGDDVILTGISLSSITGYQYSGNASSGVLTLQEASGNIALNFAGNYSTSSFVLTDGSAQFSGSQPSVIIAEGGAPCFAAGTRITTPLGNVRVEELAVGGLVTTASGSELPIKWIGRRHVSCHHHPHPEAVRPVKIARDAFAPKQPSRDLLLSPDHAVFVDDVLIPIKYLINDSSITQTATDQLYYYHLELSRHDVLLAEGLPAESYLDTGDRSSFENGGGGVMRLFPEFGHRSYDASVIWDASGCARLVVTGPILEAVRSRLAKRARLLHRRAHASAKVMHEKAPPARRRVVIKATANGRSPAKRTIKSLVHAD